MKAVAIQQPKKNLSSTPSTLIAASVFCAIALMTTGCVTPPGPSVASLGAGSDAAYLNATRGRADAQISQAQARQYSTQRQQVSEEMALEQQKKNNTMQDISNTVNVVGGVLHAIPGL